MYKSVRHTCITVYHTGHAAHSANFFALFSSVETKSSLGDRNPNASKLGQLLLSVGDFQGKQGKPIPPAPAPLTHTHTCSTPNTELYLVSSEGWRTDAFNYLICPSQILYYTKYKIEFSRIMTPSCNFFAKCTVYLPQAKLFHQSSPSTVFN